jgi:hypothetical protein
MRKLIGELIVALPTERHLALLHQRERLNASIARSFPDNKEKFGSLSRRSSRFGDA